MTERATRMRLGRCGRVPFTEVGTMPYVQARDGTPLHYNDWGSGPPVVLIHGWPLNADM